MNHSTEEDYLKAIYSLSKGQPVSTNDLANELKVKASSITDMIKKLSDKKLYQKRSRICLGSSLQR